MVKTSHPRSQDDTENRFKHDDNGQGNHRTIQRRTGDKDKRHFYLGLRKETVTAMTKTLRDNDPNKMKINQLFRLDLKPEKNFLVGQMFFGIIREPNETAEDVWTRILQTEKNCELHNVTPAELIASKFLSQTGRSR